MGEDERLNRDRLRAFGMAAQFGGTVLGALVVCLGGGIWLDRRLGTSPLFLFVGLVLAFATIGYSLYQIAKVPTPRAPVRRPAPPSPARDEDDDEDDEDDDYWR
jgi:ATP synthase protein I